MTNSSLLEVVNGSMLVDDHQPITLSSGIKTDRYFDLKSALLTPFGNYAIVDAMIKEIFAMQQKLHVPENSLNTSIQSIGGPGYGGALLTSAILNELMHRPTSQISRGFVVRTNRKLYGREENIIGCVYDFSRIPVMSSKGLNCLIIDDVTTTGNSLIDTIKAVDEAGGNPVGIITILERDGFDLELIRSTLKKHFPKFADIPYKALITEDEVKRFRENQSQIIIDDVISLNETMKGNFTNET